VQAGQHHGKTGWFLPAQMQALNPMLVMLLIPFNNLVLYPMLNRSAWPTALRRMGRHRLSSLAWIVIGLLQLALDGGNAVSIMWQILPYALLTFGEVLVSATGLEFRLQPGARLDEGRHHELLEPVDHGRQPVGADRQRSVRTKA
jgi:dipeptide/tripeptide permease